MRKDPECMKHFDWRGSYGMEHGWTEAHTISGNMLRHGGLPQCIASFDTQEDLSRIRGDIFACRRSQERAEQPVWGCDCAHAEGKESTLYRNLCCPLFIKLKLS